MRDNKMTVSTSHIWKSAAATIRQQGQMRDKNLHIGGTLRDLYVAQQMPKTDKTFTDLLNALHTAEEAATRHRRR